MIGGLFIESASISNQSIIINDVPTSSVPFAQLRWVEKKQSQSQSQAQSQNVKLPVYLNSSHQQMLFVVEVSNCADSDIDILIQRGVAIIASGIWDDWSDVAKSIFFYFILLKKIEKHLIPSSFDTIIYIYVYIYICTRARVFLCMYVYVCVCEIKI